jgi:hypothetical protein
MDVLRAIFIVFGLFGMLSVGSCMMLTYGTVAAIEHGAKAAKKNRESSGADSSRFRVQQQNRYKYDYERSRQERAYDYKQNKLDDSDWRFGDPGMETQ